MTRPDPTALAAELREWADRLRFINDATCQTSFPGGLLESAAHALDRAAAAEALAFALVDRMEARTACGADASGDNIEWLSRAERAYVPALDRYRAARAQGGSDAE